MSVASCPFGAAFEDRPELVLREVNFHDAKNFKYSDRKADWNSHAL